MTPNFLLAAALLGGGLLAAAPASAGEWLQWHSSSLSYLNGRDYAVDPGTQQTLTLEHANAWKYGDTFAFVDITAFSGEDHPSSGAVTYYGEFAPRFSLGKLLDHHIGAGAVTDVLLATAYEFGEADADALLVGAGIDLEVPGFRYVQLNAYRRLPRHGGGPQWQLTPVWAWSIPVGASDLLVDGYIDWVVDNARSRHAHLHINPQVKYDLGKAVGGTPGTLYVGVEYDYWKNKYGIADQSPLARELGGTSQSTTSLLIKVHLP